MSIGPNNEVHAIIFINQCAYIGFFSMQGKGYTTGKTF